MRKFHLIALLSLTLLALPSAVWAHAHLKTAQPAAGATLHEPPNEIRLTFTQGVELPFSKISVTAEGGAAVATQALETVDADHTVLVVKFKSPLTHGTYQVDWQVTSVDTHKSDGHFTFTIGH